MIWASCPTACLARLRWTTRWSARTWSNCGARRCQRQPGKSYSQMLNTAGDALKGAVHHGGESGQREGRSGRANLDEVDFLVVQDLF